MLALHPVEPQVTALVPARTDAIVQRVAEVTGLKVERYY